MTRDEHGQERGPELPERVPSGVRGLDRVLEGGLLRYGSYLISGGPGTGKTVLTSQIAFAAGHRGESTVFVSVLTESYASLMRNLQGFSFFDENFANVQVQFVASFAVLETEGFAGFEEMLRLTLRKHRPSFVILDNMGTLRSFARSDREHRALLRKIIALASMSRATVLASSDESSPSIVADRNVFDAVIELRQERAGMRTSRLVEVVKSRGSGHVPGAHEFEILAQGVHVYPRLEALGRRDEQPSMRGGWRSFGVDTLDRMLGGGLLAGSSTAVAGPSGVGKTLLALRWLHEGVVQGEKSLYFGFHEPPGRLVAAGEGIGLDLEEGMRAGLLELKWQAPGEVSLDRFGHELLEWVECLRPSRVVVDSIGGLVLAAPFADRIPRFLATCTMALRELGATVMFTDELRLFSQDVVIGNPIASTFENLLELRFCEREDRLDRLLAVRKTRGSDHDPRIRSFSFTGRGIVVDGGGEGP